MAQQLDACSNAPWRGLQVVGAYSAWDPVLWFNMGFGSFFSSGTPANTYITGHVLMGASVSIAVGAVILMYLLCFVGWRLLLCCGCCKPIQLHHTGAQAVLNAPWLLAHKALATVAVAAAIVFCIVAMVKLPTHPIEAPSTQADQLLVYVGVTLNKTDATMAAVTEIKSSLRGVSNILDVDINESYINSQLDQLLPFVVGLPDPVPLQRALSTINGKVVTMQPAAVVVGASFSGLLAVCQPALVTVGGLGALIKTIRSTATIYSNALVLPTSFTPVDVSSAAVTQLQSAQEQLRFTTWQSQLLEIGAAASVMQTKCNDSVLLAASNAVKGLWTDAASLQAPLLQLLTALRAIDRLNPVAVARLAVNLSTRLHYIDANIIQLDAATMSNVGVLDLAEESVGQLYPAGMNSTGNSSIGGWIVQLQNVSTQVATLAAGNVNSVNLTSVSKALQELTKVQQLVTQLVPFLENAQNGSRTVNDSINTHLASQSSTSYNMLRFVTSYARPLTLSMLNNLPTVAEALKIKSEADSAGTSLVSVAGTARDAAASATVLLGDWSTNQATYDQTLGTLTTLVAALPTPRSQVVEGPRAMLRSTVGDASASLQDITSQVDNAVSKVAGKTQELRTGVILDVTTSKKDGVKTVDKYWAWAYIGIMSFYGLFILLLLCLLLGAWLNCPGSITAFSISSLLAAIVLLVLSLVVLAVMVVLQDGCTWTETTITTQLRTKGLAPALLARYYFYQEPAGASLKDVLALAGVVDVDQIKADINTAEADLLHNLQANHTLQPKLSAALLNITDSVAVAMTGLDVLLASVEYGPVSSRYIALKSSACCTVGAILLEQWVCFVGAGIMAGLTVVFAMLVLARLDALPKKNCLGCQCYSIKHYNPPVIRDADLASNGIVAGDLISGVSGESLNPGRAPPLAQQMSKSKMKAGESEADRKSLGSSFGGSVDERLSQGDAIRASRVALRPMEPANLQGDAIRVGRLPLRPMEPVMSLNGADDSGVSEWRQSEGLLHNESYEGGNAGARALRQVVVVHASNGSAGNSRQQRNGGMAHGGITSLERTN